MKKQEKVDYKSIFDSLDQSFIEWFVGFSDAEANFQIKLNEGKVQLMFQIGLHLDDYPLLCYIKEKLQCGYITLDHKRQKANYVISSQEALLGVLVPIFDSFHLNTTKYLNYIAFREVINMRTTKDHLTPKGRVRILCLKASMNKARTEFDLSADHQVHITWNWLLGFVEGDGSFSFSGVKPRLSIQLTLIDKPVLVAINEFFGGIGSLTIISRSSQEGRECHAPEVALEFRQIAFLYNVIVPTFTSLTFYSKKGLDFADWAICVRVYFSGRHTLQEGKELIALLRSRMNNNRLSTNPDNKRDLVIPQERIDGVFNLSAPYEVRKGARDFSGSNKLVPESFPVYVSHPDGLTSLYPSLSQCALAMGISRNPIRKYLDSGTPYNGYFFSSTPPESNS